MRVGISSHSVENTEKQARQANTLSPNLQADSQAAHLNSSQRNVLHMQQRVGNSAVQRMLNHTGAANPMPRKRTNIVRRAPDDAPPAAEQTAQETPGSQPPSLGAVTETNPDGGVRVTSINPGSRAAASLHVNDIIKSVNNVDVASNEEFLAEVQKHQAGDTVTLGVQGASGADAAPPQADAAPESGGDVQPMRNAIVQRDAADAGTVRPVSVQLQGNQDAAAPGAAVSTQTVRVVIKSHIKPIIPNIGTLPMAPTDYLPFPNPMGSTMRLAGFAAATDLIMREDPPSDAMDVSGGQQYRLFSATNLTITKQGTNVTGITATPLETDGGWEGPLKAYPLNQFVPLRATAPNSFTWGVSGAPHPAAAAPMQLVYPRSNEYIWHIITGNVDAAGHVTFSITHSGFPSVSIYIDGVKSTAYNQGNASLLWVGGGLRSS